MYWTYGSELKVDFGEFSLNFYDFVMTENNNYMGFNVKKSNCKRHTERNTNFSKGISKVSKVNSVLFRDFQSIFLNFLALQSRISA